MQITSKNSLAILAQHFNKHGYRTHWEERTHSFEPLLAFHFTTTDISCTMCTMVH